MSEQLKKSEALCLKALDDMCEMLAKAMPSQSRMWAGVKPSKNVPDMSLEQVQQARGSIAPIESEVPSQEDPQQDETQGDPELPNIDPSVVRDLSGYTPDHLHGIVQHASRNIANALMESIMAHQQENPGKKF